jgi:excisionase family DNA binding protein
MDKIKSKVPVASVPDVFTVDEAAAYLRISRRTLYRLAESRRLPARKVGGQWRFHRLVLEKYLGVPQSARRGRD